MVSIEMKLNGNLPTGEFAVFSTVIAASGDELSFVAVTRLIAPVPVGIPFIPLRWPKVLSEVLSPEIAKKCFRKLSFHVTYLNQVTSARVTTNHGSCSALKKVGAVSRSIHPDRNHSWAAELLRRDC
jgi:hypothetical protein